MPSESVNERTQAGQNALFARIVAESTYDPKGGDVRVAATGASQSGVMRVPAIEAALKSNWSASAIDGVTVPEPQGAFYVYPDVSALLGRDFDGSTPQTSAELAGLILEKAQVAVVPGEAFGPSGYFRLSYALGDDDLAEGLSRLQNFLGGTE